VQIVEYIGEVNSSFTMICRDHPCTACLSAAVCQLSAVDPSLTPNKLISAARDAV